MKKYCAYCGEKLQHKIYTDATTNLVCKSSLCGIYEQSCPTNKELVKMLNRGIELCKRPNPIIYLHLAKAGLMDWADNAKQVLKEVGSDTNHLQ